MIIEHPYWMQTVTGLCFDYIDPKPEQVCLEDIAHHLATAAIRFNGATREPYSVAQHSVWVADYLRTKHARGPKAIVVYWDGTEKIVDRAPWTEMAGLMHDSPEYVTGDMVRPWKRLLGAHWQPPPNPRHIDMVTAVGKVEDHYLGVILKALVPELVKIYERRRWGGVVQAFDRAQVKDADMAALATERRDLVAKPSQPWVDNSGEEWGPEIVPLPWRVAKDLFLRRFNELKSAMEASR